jgi:poly(A) polymerase
VWVIGDTPSDVRCARAGGGATLRSEGPYRDGRRPEHVAFTSAEEDARRRDFTINGMFYDPAEQRVLDFVGGEKDLAASVIRAIGDPHARMNEDKLRLLRAVRFAATLEFELEERTADAVREMAREILVVSAERIAEELRRMLVDRHRSRAIRLAGELSLLATIVPELAPIIANAGKPGEDLWTRTLQMLQLLQEPGFELAAATLLHSLGEGQEADGRRQTAGGRRQTAEGRRQTAEGRNATPHASAICRRLRLSNGESEHIEWLVAHQHDLDRGPELALFKLKRLLAHPLIDSLLALARVRGLAAGTDLGPILFCEEYLRNTPADVINPPALITGDDLISRGLPRGPIFRHILEQVRDAQLDGQVTTREQALKLADRLAAEREGRIGDLTEGN